MLGLREIDNVNILTAFLLNFGNNREIILRNFIANLVGTLKCQRTSLFIDYI